MASKNIIEIVIKATDQASQVAKQVEKATNQLGTNGSRSVGLVTQASQRLTSAWSSMRNTASSAMSTVQSKFNSLYSSLSNIGTRIKGVAQSFTQLIPGFSTVAESIKTKWSTTVEYIKSKTKSITSSASSLSAPFKSAFSSIESNSSSVTSRISSKWQSLVSRINGTQITPKVNTQVLTPAEKKINLLKQKMQEVNNLTVTPRFSMTQLETAHGKTQVIVKDLKTLRSYPVTFNTSSGASELNNIINQVDRVHTRLEKVNGTVVTPQISPAGLNILNGKIVQTEGSFTQLGNRITSTNSKLNALGNNSGIARLRSSLSSLKGRISGLASGFSGLGGAISMAFGAIGVTSVNQFTIGAAMAREKINSVTTSITGSKQATKELGATIKSATAGGVVGFNSTAQALNQVAIKFHMNTSQMKAAAPAIANIGNLSVAMGHSQEQAANMMAHAYDGLNGNFKTLKQNLGVTKEQLMQAGWSGAADDVDGYTNALNKVLEKSPKLQAYYNSTEGRITRAKMAIQGVGREVGETLLPVISQVLQAFLDLNQKCPGITKAFIYLGIAIMGLSAISMVVLPIIELSKALKLAATAQWLLNAAMDANPIMIVVIAIIALVAILVYLYYNNEQVRNTINALGSYLSGTFIGLWDYLCGAVGNTVQFFQNLYSAIVNLPETLSNIGNSIWSWVTGLPGQISSALTGIGTAVASWISSLWTNISTWLNNGLATLGTWFSTLITTLITWGQNILTTIITWLTMLPGTIFTYLLLIITTIGQWELQLWNIAVYAGSQFVGGIITWIQTLPGRVWTWLLNTINRVIQWVTVLWNIAVYAGSQFVGGIITWIQTLPGRIWTWLMNTINRVTSFATIIMNKAKYAGSVMVGHFISYVSTLPGKFWTWLLSTLSRITSFASQGASRMRTTAMNMCNAFKNKVSQLPNIMWTELMHIGDKIRNAVGELGKAMRDLAHNMLNKFKDALGIHSPGYMFKAIKGEMQYIDDQLSNSQKKLGKSAEKLGQGVLNGFNKTDFTDMTTPLEDATQTAQTTMQTGGAPVSANSMLGGRYTPTSDIQQDQNTTTPQIGSLVNTDQLTADTSLITTETQKITATIGTNSQRINTSLQGTQLTWGNLVTASNTGTQNLMANNTKTTTGYRNMTTQVGTQLNNLKSKNTSAWQNVKTTTQNNLNNILHSTKNVTTQMISAWNTMKNSIISAAQSIKSQSESRFNSLWSTISRFYHRIRNPGGAGSPSESRGSGVRRSNGGSAIRAASTGISSIFKPRKRKVQSIDLSGVFSQPEIQYMTPSGSNKMIATSDIMRYMNTKGAGWNDIVSPNNRYIRNESNKWKANGPKVYGKYPTGNDLFKVKEFENGTPQVSYETFKKMAESVFSHCNYLFYWDSERYGSWQAAAQNGNMNCSDSSDFLIALAHACGLSASKVHGHWNQFGHFWANVAGHKMDTTGWMLHRTWTPSQSHAGPAPKLDFGQNTSTPSTVDHTGTINIEMNLHVEGADNVDENTLTEALRDAITQPEILKRIATNSDFQEYDNRTKIRLNSKIARNG